MRLAQERKEDGGEVNPSARQLNDLMHKAMYTVNHILYNLEKEKGKKTILRYSEFDEARFLGKS